jgi:O-antigen biosynthesis protein
VRACFLLPDLQLSGGVGVVLRHASEIEKRGEDIDVAVLLTNHDAEPAPYGPLRELSVRHISEVEPGESFDVLVATWWETAYRLFELEAHRRAYFVQSLEDRFYRGDDPVERGAVALTYDMPVSFITEARWIRDFLTVLRPEADCHYVRNGVDKEVFRPLDSVEYSPAEQPLRVLIEGNPDHWLKAVPDALEAVGSATRPLRTTLVSPRPLGGEYPVDRAIGPLTVEELAAEYAGADVVLKLSRVEGMFGPPLEGFHKGATCVVTPVTGHEEYVVHGHNGVVTDFDDIAGVSRWLDLLAADRDYLHELRTNALATAREWPSWEETSLDMASALRAIEVSPPADPYAGARELMRHAWATAEASRGEFLRRSSEAEYATRAIDEFRETRAFKAARALQGAKQRVNPLARVRARSNSRS